MRRAASTLLIWAAPLAMQLAGVPPAGAQGVDVAIADRAPRFLYAASARATPVVIEARNVAALRRRVTLQLDGVPLREALEAISRQAGLRLFYSKDLLPLEQLVRISAEDLTVAAALTEVLFDTDVDVLLGPSNQAALVRRGAVLQSGTITGRVTDASTQQGVSGVRVFLERTRWGTTTDSAGGYRLTEVAPGAYTLVARRIGYRAFTQPVTIEADREVTVDVTLQPAPSVLDAVVVTATGEQRLLELGHVVGTINADSLVRAVPVTSVSDLLSARVPGVLVTQNDGQVGGNVQVRIRGPNTILGINAAPVVVVDGIRFVTSRRGLFPFGFPEGDESPFGAEPTSRLNDLNINDIQSIEIVKGAAAATLYGTDAANGVIVITTKRGQPGPARWRAYLKTAMTEIPISRFPDNWWGWSRLSSGQQSTSSCTLLRVAAGACVQDSVTNVGNALNDPEWTIFDSKPRWEYGANVSGGREDLRYYFSADLEEATGPIRLPSAEEALVKQRLGVSELREEMREPNRFSKANLRANMTAALGEKGEIHVSTGYTQSATRTIPIVFGNVYNRGAFTDVPSDTSSTPYATSNTPGEAFAATSTEDLRRWTLSANGQWRLTPWLLGRATTGLDLANSARHELLRRGEAPGGLFCSVAFCGFAPNGRVGDVRTQRVAYTVTVDATATGRRGLLSSRTTVGAQYHRELTDGLTASRSDLLPGGESFAQATSAATGQQNHVELATLGSYVEQTVGLNERLFATGALRADGASTFGQGYDVTLNPKASFSWLVSEEPFFPRRVPGLDQLRLRYAFGSSTIQPYPTMARTTYFTESAFAEGQQRTAVAQGDLGNQDLRPERAREHELGLDASGWGQRVQLELSWYRRRIADGLQVRLLPSSVSGFGTRLWTNVGLVTNNGFEARLTARLLDTRPLSWDVALQHSYYDNRLVKLGLPPSGFIGGYAEGYPLGVAFNRPIVGFADTAGGGPDGLIQFNEVVMGDTVFVGRSIPPRAQVLSTTVGLFDQRLRISALFDRRSGHVVLNAIKGNQCFSRCRAAVDPTTPLEEQAEVVAQFYGNSFFGGALGPAFGFWEKGDMTRLRELSVMVSLPPGLLRLARLREATLTLQGRNLALWKSFSGPDPESAGRGSVNNVAPEGANGIPQGRTWTLRLDIGF